MDGPLLTSLDGTTYPRSSAPIRIPGMVGAALIGGFALAGRRATGRQVPVLPHGQFRGDSPRHAPALADGRGLLNGAGRGLRARAGHAHRRVMQMLVIIVQNGVPHSELGRQPSVRHRLWSVYHRPLAEKSPLNHYQLVKSVDVGQRVCSAVLGCRSVKRLGDERELR